MHERNLAGSHDAATVTLADRYTVRHGRVVITGVQALVRLMLVQAERDKAAGLNTAGFVSGYRGSPLGTLDTAFAGARDAVSKANILVKPAINEEMAATAIAGSQQIEASPGARVDGVFALWYGKGPGFDRAADAIRHGNMQGSSPKGGVVLAVGDDHLAKSSSIVCYSDEAVVGVQVPLFYPADAGEIVSLGLHAFALSRLTGAWTALKILTDVADATRSVPTDEIDMPIVVPEIAAPPVGLHFRWPILPLDQELRHNDYRIPAIHAYVRANRLDRSTKPAEAKVGLVSPGKSWLDLQEALGLLGLDEADFDRLGIALYKPAVIWPLEPEGIKEFASGLDSIIVVEEKGPLIENQIKSILYRMSHAPDVLGKHDAAGNTLLPGVADLTPERIAAALAPILAAITGGSDLQERGAWATGALDTQRGFALAPSNRTPYFCSGCPHNRSTAVPEGSRAMAGIGCHGMAAMLRPRHGTYAQMGGEGVHWMGLSPFTDERHMFANLGDGTYFHSGLLAIRQAVAAKLNITYKLLFNSAVAMTGGQSVDGELTVPMLVDQLAAEGIRNIVISTDDPARYDGDAALRGRVQGIEHRDDLEALQLRLRDTPGVSVIIYDQMCATEKRRLRKRGKMADPDKRLFINELVCEGCGDCSVKSNCLSVEPVKTSFGVKRRINQSTCNKDYSCVNGFCPSFVTVEGATLRKKSRHVKVGRQSTDLPAPQISVEDRHQRIMVAGVGGTGVVTIGALLSMSGHMAGRNVAVLDQVGMAQKGGAVTSHVHIARDDIQAVRIPVGQASLVIVCDQIVGNSRDVMSAIAPGKTCVIANADVLITGEFTQNRNAIADSSLLARRLEQHAGADRFIAYPFVRLAEALLGDAIASNLMMLGAAYQKGWVDVDLSALEAAVGLNGVAVDFNLAAFAWGRQLVVDPASVVASAGLAEPERQTLDDMVAERAAFLTEYQNADYADQYLDRIDEVRAAESRLGTHLALTEAAARGLFKVMAYKDEYEVARLYTDGTFRKAIEHRFEGPVKLSFHMAPPIMARRDPVTGHLRKRRLGSWMMPVLAVLARFRGLRGTALDPFGGTHERRAERALIGAYSALLSRLAAEVNRENQDELARIAGLVMDVRGYGHVKEASLAAYQANLEVALAALGEQVDGAGPCEPARRAVIA